MNESHKNYLLYLLAFFAVCGCIVGCIVATKMAANKEDQNVNRANERAREVLRRSHH